MKSNWLIVRKSRTVIGGYTVVQYGLTEEVARRRADAYKTPHIAMPEPELLKIRIAALNASEQVK